jgi:hypothetical protein
MRGGTSWKQELCEVIDLAVENTDNMSDFENFIGKYGVEISRNTAKSISFRHPEKKKPIRGEKLGANYTKQALEDRLVRVRDHDVRAQVMENLSADEKKLVQHIETYTEGKRHFIDIINSMAAWAEHVQKKAAELRRREEQRRYYDDAR